MLERIKQNKAYKWLDNYWYHYKWVTLAVVFFVTVFSVLTAQMLTKEKPDAVILYGGPAVLTANETRDLETAFRNVLPSDFNADGKKLVQLETVSLMTDEQVAEAEVKAEEESSVFVYDAKALGSNKTTFTELMMSGEYVILLVDRAQYDNILDSGAIVPLADLFDADKIPDCAYDDSSIVFSETPFAQFFNATDVLPEDTLLCVLQASENSIFKGKDKAETQYRQQLMLYKKMINFSKGKESLIWNVLYVLGAAARIAVRRSAAAVSEPRQCDSCCASFRRGAYYYRHARLGRCLFHRLLSALCFLSES